MPYSKYTPGCECCGFICRVHELDMPATISMDFAASTGDYIARMGIDNSPVDCNEAQGFPFGNCPKDISGNDCDGETYAETDNCGDRNMIWYVNDNALIDLLNAPWPLTLAAAAVFDGESNCCTVVYRTPPLAPVAAQRLALTHGIQIGAHPAGNYDGGTRKICLAGGEDGCTPVTQTWPVYNNRSPVYLDVAVAVTICYDVTGDFYTVLFHGRTDGTSLGPHGYINMRWWEWFGDIGIQQTEADATSTGPGMISLPRVPAFPDTFGPFTKEQAIQFIHTFTIDLSVGAEFAWEYTNSGIKGPCSLDATEDDCVSCPLPSGFCVAGAATYTHIWTHDQIRGMYAPDCEITIGL